MLKASSLARRGLALAGILAAMTAAPAAQATVAGGPTGSVGHCSIQANLVIQSLHLGIGGSRGIGRGDIICNYVDGSREIIPVVIKTKGAGVGLGLSKTEAFLFSTGIGVASSGYTLLGKYATVKGSAQAVIIGAEVGLSLTAKRGGFSIPLDLKVKGGPGLEVAADLGQMKIELDRSRLAY